MRPRADRIGLLLLAGSLIVLVSLCAVNALLQHGGGEVDRGSGPSAETVVLIDLTDPQPDLQRSEVGEFFRGFATDSLKPHEQLTLWTLSGARDGVLTRQFSRCCPCRSANPLIGNRELTAAASDSLFVKPLQRVLDSLPTHETAAATPLLEAVQQTCSQPEFPARGVPRRLVLVSNLEQNSGLLSVYRQAPDFGSFRRTPGFRRIFTDLRGVTIEVLFAPHGHAAVDLNTSLQDFWRDYFLACGAASVRIRRL